MPCACLMSSSRLRIWPRIDTSAPDSGSSATMRRGCGARARAAKQADGSTHAAQILKRCDRRGNLVSTRSAEHWIDKRGHLVSKLRVAQRVLRRALGKLHVTLEATAVSQLDLDGRIVAGTDDAIGEQARRRHQARDLWLAGALWMELIERRAPAHRRHCQAVLHAELCFEQIRGPGSVALQAELGGAVYKGARDAVAVR